MESLYLLEYPSISIYNFRSRFHRWADTVFIFGVWLLLFNIMASQFYPFTCQCHHHFSLSLHKIPLCVWTTFSLFIHLLMGWFCFLAIVNSTAKTTDVQVSLGFLDSKSFRYIPKRDIAVSVSIFWGPLSWFPQWPHKFTFWSAVNKCSPFHIFFQIR